MLSKELVAASTVPLLLSVLSEGENYGYALIQRVRELSEGDIVWTEGMLYPVLHWMEDEELVTSEWRDRGRPAAEVLSVASGRAASPSTRAKTVDECSRNFYKIMENKTSFDLNAAIHEWRKVLAASPAMQRDDLDQLESHLRDATEHWMANGLTGHEAFAVAKGRLGAEREIAKEFAKVNAADIWLDRVFWMVAGSVCIGAITNLSYDVGNAGAFALLKWRPYGGVSSTAEISLFVATLMVLLTLAWRAGSRKAGRLWNVFIWLRNHPVFSGLIMIVGYLSHVILNAMMAPVIFHMTTLPGYSAGAIAMTTSLVFATFARPAVLVVLLMRARRKQSIPA